MMGMGFGVWSVPILLLFGVGLAALGALTVNALFPHRFRQAYTPEERRGAYEIINRRYARGEITRQEYEIMKRNIKDSEENPL